MRVGRLLAASLIFAAAVTGCLDGGDEGQASLYVTGEAPAEASELSLNITAAHIRQADVDRANASQESDDTKGDVSGAELVVFSEHRDGDESELPRFEEAAGWVQIVNAPDGVTVTFGDEEAGAATFLGEQDVPTGEYDEVGFLIDDAQVRESEDNASEAGITDQVARTNASVSVEMSMETRTVLSLDVEESLSQDEEADWRLSPAFGQTQVETVPDEASGDEQHEQGEAAELDRQGG